MSKPAIPTLPASPCGPHEGAYVELAVVLADMVQVHEQLLRLSGEHRRALAQADLPGIHACIARQGELTARVGRLETRRGELVQLIAGTRTTRAEVRLSTIVDEAPANTRDRLKGLSSVLRDVLTRLHTEQTTLRIAAEHLAGHMEGVMRQVYRQLSHAGTYARSGRVDAHVQVVTGLDVRT